MIKSFSKQMPNHLTTASSSAPLAQVNEADGLFTSLEAEWRLTKCYKDYGET